MARAAKDKAYRTFVNGFVTEATGLTFPENSCRDIDNCDIELKGTLRRRLGLNEEAGGYTLGAGLLVDQVADEDGSGPFSIIAPSGSTCSADELAITVHPWPHPGGRTDLNFVVFQIGNAIIVRDWDNEPVTSPSAIYEHVVGTTVFYLNGAPGGSVNGIVYKGSNLDSARSPLQAASGFGRLWFAGPYVLPFYLAYDPITRTLECRAVGYDATDSEALYGRLAIRDFNGVPDGLRMDEQPTTLSPEHAYNLYNQGWSNTVRDAYFSEFNRYPSNAQQWILGKDNNDDFDAELLGKQDFGNSPAPKGRIVMNALTGNRDGLYPGGAMVLDSQDEPAITSFTSTAFYAGRVWLSGDVNPKRPNGVYFSKTLSRVEDSGYFMQMNDPTSEHFSDLLATDGGVIYLTEASTIKRLVPFGAGLLVMADNGIWFIYGGEGGFTASNFSVEKVSSTGLLGATTVAATDQSVVFFAENSVQMIALPENGVVPAIIDIGQGKIFSFYGLIEAEARERASACFDYISKKVFWSWLEADEYSFPHHQSRYNRMLILDTRTGAFTKYSFSTTDEWANGPAFPKRKITRPLSLDVVVVEDQGVVTTSGDGDVILFTEAEATDEFLNSVYVTIADEVGESLKVGAFYDTNFRDYRTMVNYTVQDYTSFVVTGDEILEDLQRNKQATFLHSFFRRTETGVEFDGNGDLVFKNPSGCTVVARWDWHNTAAGGRWSDSQRAYRYRRPLQPEDETDSVDTGEEIVYTKLKIRGKGRALTLRYESVPEKDFQLLGFSAAFTANGV